MNTSQEPKHLPIQTLFYCPLLPLLPSSTLLIVWLFDWLRHWFLRQPLHARECHFALRELVNPRKRLQAKSMEVIIANAVDESSLSFNLSPKGHVNEQLESDGTTNYSTILQ